MIRTCQKCGEDCGVYENELGMDRHVLCRCMRRKQLLIILAAILLMAVVFFLLPKKSEGSPFVKISGKTVDVEKTAKALRHESNSRARKVTAENPKTSDEWALYHYYGISPEEIRKGIKR